MTIRGWHAMYLRITREFGYSIKDDYNSASKLDSIIKSPIPIGRIRDAIKGRTVFVIGSGPSLSASIQDLKKHDNPKIVADSALCSLLENGILPDIVVTDLDGDEKSLKSAASAGCTMIVHAHGDNIDKLHMARDFPNCIGTAQGRTPRNMFNFGGFTDGDRGVFLASALGAKRIILFGMDLDGRIGRLSRTTTSEKKTKLKKLKKAKELLVWLASRSNSDMYTASSNIPGFKKIQLWDLADY